MTIDEANRQLISQLGTLYDEREAAAITSMVMEKLTGMDRSLRLMHKTEALAETGLVLFQQYIGELMQHRPVQYVLGEAWFAGLKFYVNEQVLVPRPETEELVDWILADTPAPGPDFKALDIGTGSGCIPVSIGKKLPGIQMMACDISPDALQIAAKNGLDNQVTVNFFLCDIRDQASRELIPALNLIVSNPPYIPEKQRVLLDNHVKNFEPALALFVPDADPLIFYKLIGQFAQKKLLPDGKLFLEIHHDFAKEIVSWYQQNGFSVELRKDLSGKNRMIRARFF
ncbi:MAG: peptide chain release factor N(5)-glutamine methyltransferase [Bacteroidota bacterium]|nr:peptide chain release factor N(5)-glutamine methyltransferase [Bacteroidota bacterium]